VTSLVGAEEFSFIIQWPEAGTIASCTSLAAKRIAVAIISPNVVLLDQIKERVPIIIAAHGGNLLDRLPFEPLVRARRHLDNKNVVRISTYVLVPVLPV
jgi:hypothetical protein